jgi:hypothetical protein
LGERLLFRDAFGQWAANTSYVRRPSR